VREGEGEKERKIENPNSENIFIDGKRERERKKETMLKTDR
jgi:hypothetical protein